MAESSERLRSLCQTLKLPTVAREAPSLAEAARRQGVAPLSYLTEVLELEVQARAERRAARRLKEAGFARIKTLEGFDFRRAGPLPEALLRELIEGEYIDRAQTVILMGEPGTGKTHCENSPATLAMNG